MDAASTAAVLAIVAAESRDAVIQDLLLERERLAMSIEDRDSYLAQHHFASGSAQIARPERLTTWERAFRQRHNDYLESQAVMRAAARALRGGDADVALTRLTAEVGNANSEATSEVSEAEQLSEPNATDGESTGEEEEEENLEDDAEVEEVESTPPL